MCIAHRILMGDDPAEKIRYVMSYLSYRPEVLMAARTKVEELRVKKAKQEETLPDISYIKKHVVSNFMCSRFLSMMHQELSKKMHKAKLTRRRARYAARKLQENAEA